MSRAVQPAVVLLRMSPQLRDGLRAAADDAGCSLNAFAIQALAAVAGDPSRFRSPVVHEPEVREIERDGAGFPRHWRDRALHSEARSAYMSAAEREDPDGWIPTVSRLDKTDLGFFVEWFRLRRAGRDGAS